VNDVFASIDKAPDRPDAFRYADADRFPMPDRGAGALPDPAADLPLGLLVAEGMPAAADLVAQEIESLLAGATVRDRAGGGVRRAQPADIAVLFRSRDRHRDYERALERRGIPSYVYKGLGFFEADEVQDVVALLRYLADPLSDLRAAALLRSRVVRLPDAALARLAATPCGIARALLADDPPDGVAAGDAARVLAQVRASVPRWLSWVDRMAPAELVGALLVDAAYAFETRGPRRRQARENLKKLRAIVARFQNRGYATLSRVADHLEELAEGDESNAALDAKDSVSLMTVHAAKGLEFPIVFIVNIGRGTGGVRAAIRIAGDERGAPSVAVADYQSEADEDALARDREETKRLVYVALTRARDRLYLSAAARNGVCRMGRGSLGEVLPASLRAAFDAAAGSRDASDPLEWAGHRLRVCGGAACAS
jgi:ATP-dependent helicase/nuclease subunit A